MSMILAGMRCRQIYNPRPSDALQNLSSRTRDDVKSIGTTQFSTRSPLTLLRTVLHLRRLPQRYIRNTSISPSSEAPPVASGPDPNPPSMINEQNTRSSATQYLQGIQQSNGPFRYRKSTWASALSRRLCYSQQRQQERDKSLTTNTQCCYCANALRRSVGHATSRCSDLTDRVSAFSSGCLIFVFMAQLHHALTTHKIQNNLSGE